MKKGKYLAPKKPVAKRWVKPLTVVLATVLTVGCIAGGTLAWLTAKTKSISNTFAVGNISLKLEETKEVTAGTDGNVKFVPGQTWEKDTTVTIEAGSEKCYLFLHIDETNNTLPNSSGEKVIQWNFNSEGWTALDGHAGYYYRTVDSSATDTSFKLISDDKLTVNANVTKNMKTQLDSTKPHLSFTAAAIQFDYLPDKNDDSSVNQMDAWELLPAEFKSTANP